jgi:thiol-disulfide isomerase/thioredoxin
MKAASIILILASILTLAACGGATSPEAPVDTTGEVAPDFPILVYQGEDVLGGQEVTFSEALAQGRPTILAMWAGLCPACRKEMPALQAAHHVYGDRVLFFGLDVGTYVGLGTEEDARALLEELAVTFPAGTTSDTGVIVAYEALGIPALYFITPNGEILRQEYGVLSEDQLNEYTEALLAASGTP